MSEGARVPSGVGELGGRVALERAARRLLRVASWLGVAFFSLQLVTFGHGRDQGIYSVVARTLLEGGMPYRDAWDFKPPGIFFVYALARALFGGAQWGIRVVEVAGLLATVLVMVRLSQRMWGDRLPGEVAGACAALCHVQLDFWHTAQPESFGGMLTVGALAAAERAGVLHRPGDDHPNESRWLAVAGVLFGLSGLLKPPLAGGGAVLALVLAAARAREQPREVRAWLVPSVRRGVAILVGGALPFAATLAFFAAKGALGDLREVLFVFTPYYTKLGWQDATVTGMVYWAFSEWFSSYASVTPVGLLLLASTGPRLLPGGPARAVDAPRGTKSALFVVLLLGVISIHLVGVAMQGKFFPYHYGATWPLTAMLVGLGVVNGLRWSAERGPLALALYAALVCVTPNLRSSTKDVADSFWVRSGMRLAMLAGKKPRPLTDDQLASVADVSAGANRAVAEFVRAHTPVDRPLFVWGFEPVIYDLAERPLASRFVYDVPQRVSWAKGPMRQTLMADLARRPPAAIVVEHRDVFPMVTGDAIDSADTLEDFVELRTLLETRYFLAERIEDFDVWLELVAP